VALFNPVVANLVPTGIFMPTKTFTSARNTCLSPLQQIIPNIMNCCIKMDLDKELFSPQWHLYWSFFARHHFSPIKKKVGHC
jgi:hypothetical protein